MPSSRARRRCILVLLAAMICCAPSCKSPISEEEKAVRAELRQALREKSYPRAVELATRIVGAHPREDGAWERLVRAQIGAGDLAGANQSVQEWRSVNRQRVPKREELAGDIAMKHQNAALALRFWSEALVANPRNSRVLRKLARLHHAAHRWSDEDVALTQLLEISEDGSARMDRALCRRRLHRWTGAVEDYRRAEELAPADPAVRRGARLFERLTKVLAEIRAVDARLAVAPNDDQMLTDRALLFLRAEDDELALEDSDGAAKMAPWAMRPRLFRALALAGLGRATEAAAGGVDPRMRLDRLAPESLAMLSRLDAEISVERENADLYISRAWQLNEMRQPGLALEDAENATRLAPSSIAAASESSYALAKLGRAEEALERIKQATDADPRSATAWQYRGELEMSRGDHDAAIASLTRAIAISQTALALQKRAECYRLIGVVVKADEDERALEQLNGPAAK